MSFIRFLWITWVSANITRRPGIDPTPFGIHVLINCGFNNSWSCSVHTTDIVTDGWEPDDPVVLASSLKWYEIVLRKLYAEFGVGNLKLN